MACRVTQDIGTAHLPDYCEAICQQSHAFHYVSISSKSINKVHSGKAAITSRPGRLEMVLDLHSRLFCSSVQQMFGMDTQCLEVHLHGTGNQYGLW